MAGLRPKFVEEEWLRVMLVNVVVRDQFPAAEQTYDPRMLCSDDHPWIVDDGSRMRGIPSCCAVGIYGCTIAGNSVFVEVQGFQVDCCVTIPFSWRTYECDRFAAELATFLKLPRVSHLAFDARYYFGFIPDGVEQSKSHKFLRLFFPGPSYLWRARWWLKERKMQAHEVDVNAALKFSQQIGVRPSGWIRVSGANLRRRADILTHAQAEYVCNISHIVAVPEEEWTIPPLVILSFDAEMYNVRHSFPQPKKDPVVVLGCTIARYGDDAERSHLNHVSFVVGSCTPLASEDEPDEVRCFESESEMLAAWRDFVAVEVDPDIVTGFNIYNFDFPYLVERGASIPRFMFLSRFINEACKLDEKECSSRGMGDNILKLLPMTGRVVIDVFKHVNRNEKMRSYSLNAVSTAFLGDQKDDLPYAEMFRAYEGSDDDRRRVVTYCRQDCHLPLRLLVCPRLEIVANGVELSRVRRTPLADVFDSGQQIGVYNQIFAYCRLYGYVLNRREMKQMQALQGAFVLEPKVGYYRDHPISILDFASLYPSIMREHYLCASNYIFPEHRAAVPADLPVTRFTVDDREHWFVQRPGVVDRMLAELLGARKRARAEIRTESDARRRTMLHSRQLALKVSANSVYGFFSANKLPCFPLAEVVTSIGRQMIYKTRRLIGEFYPASDVVYGDTDSVMVRFGVTDVATAFRRGEEAAARVTAEFGEKIVLEMENVYHPLLLLKKKRYVAETYASATDEAPSMTYKGVDTVRRDTAIVANTILKEVLDQLVAKRSQEGALAAVVRYLGSIADDAIPFEAYVMSKRLKASYAQARDLPPHAQVVEMMRKRDPGSEPQVGDRVEYVLVKRKGATKMAQRVEDPAYARAHDLKVDRLYYVEHYVLPSLQRVFVVLGIDIERSCVDSLGRLRRDALNNRALTDFFAPSSAPSAPDDLSFARDFLVPAPALPPKRARKRRR